ncbi:rhodanese-like domain-containing protein [Streptomyces sp. NBC_01233]|uniref:rhodanese-like domain-containing protein n=1 Tax=Streptomyces sp. NBC_01233 TaxID=2903787 RepID=UPI002E0ED5C2|nr:DUF2892 domain-containing protein [Streptomyces sp. NBC_01233]
MTAKEDGWVGRGAPLTLRAGQSAHHRGEVPHRCRLTGPTAANIPLDRIGRALPELRQAAGRKALLLVCSSGARSDDAAATLASHGIPASSLSGGTTAWAAEGHGLQYPAGRPRAVRAMERQVRFTAGAIVLLGLALGLFVHPAFQLLSAGIAAGLVFCALTNTCGMAVVLGRPPFNQRGKQP